MVSYTERRPVRSYLFSLSALGFPQQGPAAPTPIPPAPTGPAKAPFPPGWTGEGHHLPLRAAHRDAFVNRALQEEATVHTVCFQSQNHKTLKHSLSFLFFSTMHVSFLAFSPLHIEEECHRNYSRSCHRAGIRNGSSGSRF